MADEAVVAGRVLREGRVGNDGLMGTVVMAQVQVPRGAGGQGCKTTTGPVGRGGREQVGADGLVWRAWWAAEVQVENA